MEELEQEFVSLKSNDCFSYIRRADRRQRPYAGLTRVCRQIRAEYLPLYNARTEFHVLPFELTRYIEIFVNPPGTKQEDITANLIVSGHRREHRAMIRMDPLRALAKTARSLNIRWAIDEHQHHEDVTPMLDALLHLDSHSALRDYVEHSVDKVEIHNAFDVDSILIVM